MTFPQLEAAGFTNGDDFTAVHANLLNDNLPDAVDGTGGGDYVGEVRLGQIESPCHALETATLDSVSGATGTVTWDMGPTGYGQRRVQVTSTGAVALTVTCSNPRTGCVYWIEVLHTSALTGTITMTWGGGGVTHLFDTGDDQPLPGVGRTLWVGRCVNGNAIYWSVEHR